MPLITGVAVRPRGVHRGARHADHARRAAVEPRAQHGRQLGAARLLRAGRLRARRRRRHARPAHRGVRPAAHGHEPRLGDRPGARRRAHARHAVRRGVLRRGRRHDRRRDRHARRRRSGRAPPRRPSDPRRRAAQRARATACARSAAAPAARRHVPRRAAADADVLDVLDLHDRRARARQGRRRPALHAQRRSACSLLQMPALALVRRARHRARAAVGVAVRRARLRADRRRHRVRRRVRSRCSRITSAEVLFAPAHQTAIAEVARSGAPWPRPTASSAFAQMVGIAIAPLLGGVLLDTIGDHHLAMWLTIATIGLAQTLCFIAFVRQRARRTVTAPAAAGSAS